MQQHRGWTQTIRTWWSGERAEEAAPLEEAPAAGEKRSNPRRPFYKGAAVLTIVILLYGREAHGQFGIDVGLIIAALHQMQGLMQNYIYAPLKTINQPQPNIATY